MTKAYQVTFNGLDANMCNGDKVCASVISAINYVLANVVTFRTTEEMALELIKGGSTFATDSMNSITAEIKKVVL